MKMSEKLKETAKTIDNMPFPYMAQVRLRAEGFHISVWERGKSPYGDHSFQRIVPYDDVDASPFNVLAQWIGKMTSDIEERKFNERQIPRPKN